MQRQSKEKKGIIARNITALRLSKYPLRGGGKQCAEEFGVSPQQWSPWERGIRTPDESRQAQIAQFFGVKVTNLMNPHLPLILCLPDPALAKLYIHDRRTDQIYDRNLEEYIPISSELLQLFPNPDYEGNPQGQTGLAEESLPGSTLPPLSVSSERSAPGDPEKELYPQSYTLSQELPSPNPNRVFVVTMTVEVRTRSKQKPQQ